MSTISPAKTQAIVVDHPTHGLILITETSVKKIPCPDLYILKTMPDGTTISRQGNGLTIIDYPDGSRTINISADYLAMNGKMPLPGLPALLTFWQRLAFLVWGRS